VSGWATAGELAPILRYLDELGFRELVRPPRAAPSSAAVRDRGRAAGTTAARTAAAGAEDAGERLERLRSLEAEAKGCTACALHQGRRNVVFGSGSPTADLMFIGEGPGAREDEQGLPFVGPAGELLTRIIEAIELSRDEVYIANVVKCRPPSNRDPLPEEVRACRRFLDGQIRLVAPRVIVALGRVAAQTLLGTDQPLGRMRGEWFEVEGVPTRVTYHPAALLRNTALKRPTWEDMQVVRDRLRRG
jgi:DNA polymerase